KGCGISPGEEAAAPFSGHESVGRTGSRTPTSDGPVFFMFMELEAGSKSSSRKEIGMTESLNLPVVPMRNSVLFPGGGLPINARPAGPLPATPPAVNGHGNGALP